MATSHLLLPFFFPQICKMYEIFGFFFWLFIKYFCIRLEFGSVLVWIIFCVILYFGDLFSFSGSVFESRICIDFCFQRLQFEGINGFSHIWLITVISYIPLVLTDHCTSSIF